LRIIRHFAKVAKMQFVRLTCKHESFYEASCPFTEMTYINCTKCWKRVGVVPTKERDERIQQQEPDRI